MIYQVHRDVPGRQIEPLINTLAEQGWRLHSIVQVSPSTPDYCADFLVTMQIDKKEFSSAT